jgi:menaquinone-dependent protoporphyrinogen oxidase
MRVLVTAASKHGATAEIGAAIAAALADAGLTATFERPADVESLDCCDAVVLGSAVYVGKWLGEATAFVERLEPELLSRPVWLFSSGPLGDPPKPDPQQAVDVTKIVASLQPRGHRLLSGRLDRGLLGFGERAVATAVRAPEGDFREWDAVRSWAAEIADELRAEG